MGTDIVVGVDGSANAAAALRWALDEAEVHGARVRAVMVWSYLGEAASPLGMGTTDDDAKAALAAAVDEVAGGRAALVDQVTVNDLAVDGLLSEAATGAMVVVGHRGRGLVRQVLLGSTARTVVERSPVPVVVVPHRD